MRYWTTLLPFLLLLGSLAWSQSESQPVAFTDVTVIPMDTERILPHRTVVIEHGRITLVAEAGRVQLPLGTQTIDGRGRFLIPGLADMHTHVDRKEMLPLFLRSGITTVLNMGLASPEFVTEVRPAIRQGTVVGPQIFLAFLIDGPGDPGPQYVALCERDAREAVDRAKLLGYDFIKAYSHLDADVYAAVTDEAREQHLPLVGHIPTAVGLEKALGAGQVMIAHAEEYYKTYFDQKADDSRVAPAVELTKHAGAYVTPNLSFFAALTERTSHPEAMDRELDSPAGRSLPPASRAAWTLSRPREPSDRFVPELATIRKLTLALSKADVPLLAGTDTPAPGMIPGVSLDEELRQLVSAGLTPFQALSAATRVPGEFIRQFVPGAMSFGTVQVGERADLVLLDANPLENIENVAHPVGVIAEGRWWPERELTALAEKPVPGYDHVMSREKRLEGAIDSLGAAEAIRREKALHDPLPLPETFLNLVGYRLLGKKKVQDAIAVFAFTTELYPDSWNAHDSLGEAYAVAREYRLALAEYRHSVALNGRNRGGMEAIQKLLPLVQTR